MDNGDKNEIPENTETQQPEILQTEPVATEITEQSAGSDNINPSLQNPKSVPTDMETSKSPEDLKSAELRLPVLPEKITTDTEVVDSNVDKKTTPELPTQIPDPKIEEYIQPVQLDPYNIETTEEIMQKFQNALNNNPTDPPKNPENQSNNTEIKETESSAKDSAIPNKLDPDSELRKEKESSKSPQKVNKSKKANLQQSFAEAHGFVNPIKDGNEDDDDEDEAIMDPDNPLMKRVQLALQQQLTSQLERIEQEIKEKEEQYKKAVKKREEIGVDLYNEQQQLARLQAMLESAQDSCNTMGRFREEAERQQKLNSHQYNEESGKLKDHSRRLEQHKQELEKISRTLKQVDLYNEELRSKIQVAKRTTLKAEEDIKKQEIEKKRQDYFIDHLTEQLRLLQERRALYETQYIAQQRETKAALETLQDASTEIEAIQFEKKQLLHQWKSSLLGLQRRDEVLEEVLTQIKKQKDALLNMSGEINGFKLSSRRAQDQNETLTLLLTKLESEVDHLKRSIESILESKEKLKESYSMYAKSLGKTESELAQVIQERQAIQLEVNAIQKATTQITLATQRIESEIADHLQTQLSIEKGTQGSRRDSNKIRSQMHEKESAIAVAQNEIGNIRLETLTVEERLAEIKDDVLEIDKELKEKNELIEKYDVEIRRRNDELGKKQAEVDLLNKKYDQLTAKNQDESVGPLEATIHNLTKSVLSKEKECAQLQQFWLRAQNELVSLTKKSAELADETQDLRMKLTVLTRRKMVVNNQFEMEVKEINQQKRTIRALQNDMVKINALLSKHATIQSALEENNLGLEQEFRAKLKIAEVESVRLENMVDQLKSEKEQALQGLLEAERQMMLWEKKIQLAKETQAALDPNVGATEIREMSAEIHRMKIRYASMMKIQEKMIQEMEKSVYRRESITLRTNTKGKGGGQASLEKHIAELTKKIRQTVNDVNECENDIANIAKSRSRVTQLVNEASESAKLLEERERQLLQEIESKLQTKQLNTTKTLLFQKQVKRLTELNEGKYAFLVKDPEMRIAELEKVKERVRRIRQVIETVQVDYGEEYKVVFQPLNAIAEQIGAPLLTV
ncbi:Coiled-coil domain-containing protein 40 [Nowakowskiella sp. JEL0407]|nr:Coiled-coil domain-containing protein 40 [Nowakowskiella sp. JEL0407]